MLAHFQNYIFSTARGALRTAQAAGPENHGPANLAVLRLLPFLSRSCGFIVERVLDSVSQGGIASFRFSPAGGGRKLRTPLLPDGFAVLYISSFA